VRVHVVNLYTDDLGNPQLPKKFQSLKSTAHECAGGMTAALLALAAIIAGIAIFSRYRVRSTPGALRLSKRSTAMLFPAANRRRSHAITGEYCNASDDCRKREQCCCHPRPAHSCAVLLERLELFWQLGIAEIVCVKD